MALDKVILFDLFQLGFFLKALRLRIHTSWGEAAGFCHIDGGGDLSLQNDLVIRSIILGQRNRGNQRLGIVLLALLYLGVKNIHLGPTLPAFLSPNVAKVLVENFGIAGIGTVEDDMKLFFGENA